MPRQCPKKHQPQRKRLEITDSAGWTHVTVGRRSKTSLKSSTSHQLPLMQSSDDDISLGQLKEHCARCSRTWNDSKCACQIRKILEEEILPSPNLVLSRCICLGLGSLTTSRDSPKYELAALISMLDLLGKKFTISSVIFQDPAFNSVDVALLQDSGYCVVTDPSAFDSIDSQTFLFAPHLENRIFSAAIKTAQPALSIGNSDLLTTLESDPANLEATTDTEAIRRYMDSNEIKCLPEFERDTWCHFTSIYWRR